MPMKDVQQKHREVFRIRFGEKDGNRPKYLTDAIRVTSESPEVIDAFIDVYGGERVAWNGTKWEAKLPTPALRIILLPGQSISQWWERYRGQVCERRCDGEFEQKSGRPCAEMNPACARNVEERTANKNDCTPRTRVSVMCPDVAVIGSGMFVCNGLIGAETLPQEVKKAEAALRQGIYVPATVRAVELVGEKTKFIVPQIEITGVSLQGLLEAAEANDRARELGEPRPHVPGRILGGGGAVAALGAGPTVHDQMAAADDRQPAPARKNSATPIPATNLAPRTAAQAGGVDVIDVEEVDDATPPASPNGNGDGASTHSPRPDAPSPNPNRVAIAAREAGLDDAGRHLLAEWASISRTTSSKLLTAAEQSYAIDGAARVKAGKAAIERDGDGAATLRHTTFGWPIPPGNVNDPEPADAGDNPAHTVLTVETINQMQGKDLVDELRKLGKPMGGKVEDLRIRLIEALGLGNEPF